MELRRREPSQLILSHLTEARSFYRRLVGLLGRDSLPAGEGMMFRNCNSIHTLGMGFAIDCLFLDRDFVIKKIRPHVQPGRMVLPIWGAQTVIEMNAGLAEKLELKTGDALYVVN